MTDLRFDITPAADPLGTILVALTKTDYLAGTGLRQELNGSGSGKIVISGSHASVTAANFARGNYVRAYDLALSEYVGGFWLTEGDFIAVSHQETGGEILTFGGPGSIAYLGRAEWWKTAVTGTAPSFAQRTKRLPISRDALVSFRNELGGINLGAGIDKHLPVGRGPGSVYYVRSLVGFALDFSDVSNILSATLNLYRSNTHGAIASPNFYIKRCTSDWAEGIKGSQLTAGGVELWWLVNAVNWGNQPSTTSTNHVNATSAASGWNSYTITDLVKAWAPAAIGGGANANYGLMLKQTSTNSTATDETGTMYAEFESRENTNDPYIELVYETITVPADAPNTDGLLHFASMPQGALLKRAIDDAQAATRPAQPIPAATYDFTASVDSAGEAWAAATAETTVPAGENYLTTIENMMRAGLTIVAHPDLLISAYQNQYGSDKSTDVFATGKVRFKHGSNLLSETHQAIHETARVSHLLVRGLSNDPAKLVMVTDSGAPVHKEGLLEYGQTDDPALLAAAGSADLARRAAAVATARITHAPGSSPTTGAYTPGWPGGAGHYWLGDIITLDTASPSDGLRAYDFSEADLMVAAISWELRAAGDWDITLDLGATYYSLAQGGFQIGSPNGVTLGNEDRFFTDDSNLGESFRMRMRNYGPPDDDSANGPHYVRIGSSLGIPTDHDAWIELDWSSITIHTEDVDDNDSFNLTTLDFNTTLRNDFNMRVGQDFNLQGDPGRDINIAAANDMNLSAGGFLTVLITGDIGFTSDGAISLLATTDAEIAGVGETYLGTDGIGITGKTRLRGNFGIVLPILAADPAGGDSEVGQAYYNSVSDTIRWYNGTVWADVGSGTGSGPFEEQSPDLWGLKASVFGAALYSQTGIGYVMIDNAHIELNDNTQTLIMDASVFLFDAGNGIVIPKLASDPAGGSSQTGQLYYNTGSNKVRWYNGSAWTDVGTGSGHTHVYSETPSGTINGSNAAFTLAATPAAGTLRLYKNGLRQRAGSGNDYTLATNTITYEAGNVPITGDSHVADYES